MHGRRLFFICGIVLFMAGGVVGATAQSMTQLVLARGIQGLGAGALMPLAIATIGDLVPPSDRGRWQGLTGAVFGVASILGPTTGGYIADNADWRWVFIVSLPVALIALVVVATTLKIPPHPERGTKIDYTGAALLAAGLSSALLGLVRGGQEAPWDSPQVLGLIGAGGRASDRLPVVGAPRRAADRPGRAVQDPHGQRGRPRRASRPASGCSGRSCSSRCSCRACSAAPRPAPASC